MTANPLKGMTRTQIRDAAAYRLQEAPRLRKNGWKLREIGANLGISRERVRQIIVKAGRLTSADPS